MKRAGSNPTPATAARVALALLALSMASAQATAEPAIKWRVENPFRMFTDGADTEIHRATFEALTAEERLNPVLSAERALGDRHEDGWAAAMTGKTCWDSTRNRHQCPTADAYMNPQSHIVVAELTGVEAEFDRECTWLTAPLGGKRTRGIAITQPCRDPVRIELAYPHGAQVAVEAGGQRLAVGDLKVSDLLIVGVGDSFGSGEGNPDIPIRFSRERAIDYSASKSGVQLAGYPARVGSWRQIGDAEFGKESARWLDQACHRSLYSHQMRAALQLAIEDPHRAVTFVGVACSGAEVTAGLFLRYKGNEWVPKPPDLSQISAVAEAQCGGREAPMQDLPEAYHMNGAIAELQGGLVLRKCEVDRARKIDLLLVSIGGNDIGFARLVANAVLADDASLRQLGGWFGQVHGLNEAETQLASVDARYKSLNRAFHNLLHIPWDEADRIVLTAYPGLAVMENGREVCPDGRAGMDVLSQFNLSAAKSREGSIAADKLHQVMRTSAKEHGWTFAERHRQEFNGRGICAGFSESAFSTADDLRLPRRIDGTWVPYNPADYRAYTTRQRWFRTPNDAFLTGNFHVAQSVLNSVLKTNALAWVQVMLAATYSGAFHPTAEGHAAMADAVVEKVRPILRKYAGRSSDRRKAD